MNSSLLSGIRGASPEMLLARLGPRLPTIATWLLGSLLGVQAALIVRDLIPQPAPVAALPAATPADSARRAVDVQRILSAHLFGEAAAGAAVDPANAPQTSLTLVLAGTIAASDPKKGLGIIGETAQTAKVYSVGDSIAGAGVSLHAVYADRVILDRNGQLEALALPRQYKGGGTSAPAPQMTDSRPGAAGGQPPAFAERVRRMIAQDPGSVAEIMRPQPVFANGVQRGYRVYPGRNRQQFSKLGLRPGDLVMAINGTPLDDPARGMEIFRSMGSADQVRVIVERDGRPQELVLNMTQLANQVDEITGQPQGMVPMDQQPPMPPEPEE
ncbi:MAG TPA: type II secretion system protein GspC [Steroidobacteraceae bacterium]|nr:type II secretion system protein GspC [Steroidobacteraceae bacterium]